MGRILGPFGIQGWVKLRTFTESPDGLASHPTWWLRTKAGWQAAVPEDFIAEAGRRGIAGSR